MLLRNKVSMFSDAEQQRQLAIDFDLTYYYVLTLALVINFES
jgi:hypothetical protein